MKKIIICLLCFCFLLVGCSNQKIEDSDKLNIVTSFYPIYIATSNIVDGVEDVTLNNMTNADVGCLHDYQLTTKDMNYLERADVFIINGGGMEAFLDKAISAYPDLPIINSSEGILEEHTHSGDEHSHEDNAHIWVSISLYIKQVENIASKLAEIDSKNAQKYEDNKNIYIEKLEKLKSNMHEELDNLENKNIVTFHEAFEFFAEEFGLNIVGVIEREPGTNPSAGEVAKIIDKIKETSATAIFVEPQYEDSTANVIARETNIPVYTLDPVVTGKLEKEEYENIMKKNLETLEEAFSNNE